MLLPRLPQSCVSPKLLNPFAVIARAAAVIGLGLGPKFSSRVEGLSFLIFLLELWQLGPEELFLSFVLLFCQEISYN